MVVTLRRRDGEVTVRVGKVINCTGPDTDLARVADPLVQIAPARWPDPSRPVGPRARHGRGGSPARRRGAAGERLFLVGPLRKGLLWENTAVPELRVEARRMAELLGAP